MRTHTHTHHTLPHQLFHGPSGESAHKHAGVAELATPWCVSTRLFCLIDALISDQKVNNEHTRALKQK